VTDRQFYRALRRWQRDMRRAVRRRMRELLLLAALAGCGDDATPAADAGPCECAFALCRSDGTCWCPTDAGAAERCEAVQP